MECSSKMLLQVKMVLLLILIWSLQNIKIERPKKINTMQSEQMTGIDNLNEIVEHPDCIKSLLECYIKYELCALPLIIALITKLQKLFRVFDFVFNVIQFYFSPMMAQQPKSLKFCNQNSTVKHSNLYLIIIYSSILLIINR